MSRFQYDDEVRVRSDQYVMCREIHDRRPFPSTVKRYLQSELLKTPPEFFWGGKLVRPTPEFEDVLHTFYIPAIRDITDEISTLGVVAIRLSKVRPRVDSDRVPVVMKHALGKDYQITVRRNQKSGKCDFAYYRLKNESGRMLQKPARDKWVYVLSGFGSDPLPDGTLTSKVMSIVKQESYIELNYAFSLKTGFVTSDPTVFTQTTKESEGIRGDEPTTDFYGGQDSLRQKESDTYDLNRAEILHTRDQQKLSYSLLPQDTDPLRMRKQGARNVQPLGVNHTLIRQHLPEHRRDWRDMNEIYQEMVAAAYGVPRVNIMTGVGVKQIASAELATRTIDTTVNEWKRILGKILTDVYCVLYGEEDCRFALGRYASDVQALTAVELFMRENKMDFQRVLVKFPIIPHDNLDNILLKYSLGMISWDALLESSRALSGYSSWDSDEIEKQKEPWTKEERMMLFGMNRGGRGGEGGRGGGDEEGSAENRRARTEQKSKKRKRE